MGAQMTLEGGPHVAFVTVEQELMPDGTILQVPVVYTQLILSSLKPGHDELKWRELVSHIQAWQKLNESCLVRLKQV